MVVVVQTGKAKAVIAEEERKQREALVRAGAHLLPRLGPQASNTSVVMLDSGRLPRLSRSSRPGRRGSWPPAPPTLSDWPSPLEPRPSRLVRPRPQCNR